uniref:glycine--tRNA ligase n=2 Tax=Spongospora subterranea TaxID=70186 RepID=A0A0H5QRL8_9EUKA|eukprot:CRZ04678.1 hypothetical protein [Spongospora subterranea]
MLEVSTSALTLSDVLKTSGHVDRFTDFMVRDVVTGDPYRADKLLESHIDKALTSLTILEDERARLKGIRSAADAYSRQDLHQVMTELGVKAEDTGNDISEPFEFNLMFGTPIGPSGKVHGYLRPETAQGIFTNFRRLLEFRGGRMPFAAAQIGLAFRNEIAPRSGLLRVREFQMAEIEHFVHPERKQHPRFASIADTVMNLLPASAQDGADIVTPTTAAVAVQNKIIDNETLAYFMARTQMFLLKIGICGEKLRFRQHKSTEMAHYASDCWDAEIHTSYGWIECVGHADRSCYDLTQHSSHTKIDLCAYDMWDTPREVQFTRANIAKSRLGPKFRKDARIVEETLNDIAADPARLEPFRKELTENGVVKMTVPCTGQQFEIDSSLVSFEAVTETKSGESYVPAVIEPSFGIGRIVYCLLEHCLTVRNPGEVPARHVFSFPAPVAPIKVSVLPLSNNADLRALSAQLTTNLLKADISVNEDVSTASIGKRYSRADEIGVPFGVTIDFDTPNDHSVTIRERDSMQQIRVKMDEVTTLLGDLCRCRISWADVYHKYPNFA